MVPGRHEDQGEFIASGTKLETLAPHPSPAFAQAATGSQGLKRGEGEHTMKCIYETRLQEFRDRVSRGGPISFRTDVEELDKETAASVRHQNRLEKINKMRYRPYKT